MPATATHSFFAQDVVEIIPSEIRNKLDINKIKMFAQSTDSLQFYNLWNFKSAKYIRRLHCVFHNSCTQEYFLNVLRYMKDNNIKDGDTLSYLFGIICHYALDSTIHPYIIYKTGQFNRKDASTYKYNGIHHFMETFLDNDMIKRRLNVNPYKFDISNFTFNISLFSEELNKTIDYSFYNTYKVKNMCNIYYKSLKQMGLFLKLFRKDAYGIKKFFYKIIDSFTSKKTFRFDTLSYHYSLEDTHNFLNSDHQLWRNPTTYDMTSTESFVDLYLKAIKFAKVLMCASYDYLCDKNIDLEEIFDNTSYVTGINCDSKKELKYFEF